MERLVDGSAVQQLLPFVLSPTSRMLEFASHSQKSQLRLTVPSQPRNRTTPARCICPRDSTSMTSFFASCHFQSSCPNRSRNKCGARLRAIPTSHFPNPTPVIREQHFTIAVTAWSGTHQVRFEPSKDGSTLQLHCNILPAHAATNLDSTRLHQPPNRLCRLRHSA